MTRSEKVGKTVAGIAIGVMVLAALFGRWLLAPYYWFYLDASPELQSRLPAPPECYVPPGLMVDGAAYATAETWEDLDGDGQRDADEPVLPDVLVMVVESGFKYDPDKPWMTHEEALNSIALGVEWVQLTDWAGSAAPWHFLPGCTCRCWAGHSVAAWSPPGYANTTPGLVDLTSNEDTVLFGFREREP